MSLDPDSIKHRDQAERHQIVNISKRIVISKNWDVHKWMIDKCKTSLQAILQCACSFSSKSFCYNTNFVLVRPDTWVYVCQFHIVQAIQRLEGDHTRVEGAPRMPYRLTYKIIRAFRKVQRCHTVAEWPAYQDKFSKDLWAACHDEEMDEGDAIGTDEDSDDEVPAPRLNKKPSVHSVSSQTSQKIRMERYRFLINYFDTYWFNDQWLSECI